MRDDHFMLVRYERGLVTGVAAKETMERYEQEMKKDDRCPRRLGEVLELVLNDRLVMS
ncbi:uncharacterized protein BDZ99DRAFT_107616 [Mytilinidion resinicola]|uniref:Uncharacterized protein n=1 Tax=Mytilinidion resinicola TaxID=574789 RepID=A0A6A6YA48_9PEZI|nr:uncharacterized protein BDZ99DRAFT_107616 [Mytilinidion resinicola]KAF2805580.1 hypothetical protein BDZ99DRAFT_107616 [Mytilinidion resinicola]